jgi:hypothetical protein
MGQATLCRAGCDSRRIAELEFFGGGVLQGWSEELTEACKKGADASESEDRACRKPPTRMRQLSMTLTGVILPNPMQVW